MDSLVAALKQAKIKPKVMDIKPLALQRLVNQPTSIIVNLEAYSLGVLIIINHIPILVRSVPLETGNLTAEAKLDLLAQELARTVKYYNESNKKHRLPDGTSLYLTGDLFNTSQVDARLEEGTDLTARLQSRTPYEVKTPGRPLKYPRISHSPLTPSILAWRSRHNELRHTGFFIPVGRGDRQFSQCCDRPPAQGTIIGSPTLGL